MKKKNCLPKNKKRRQLEIKCIEKFFYKILPKLQEISEDEIFQKVIGGNINSLGVEGALEACIGLFEDGRLQLKVKSIDNFVIYTIFKNEIAVIYDTERDN